MIASNLVYKRLGDLKSELTFAITRRLQKIGKSINFDDLKVSKGHDNIFLEFVEELWVNSEGNAVFIGDEDSCDQETTFENAIENELVSHAQLASILEDLEKLMGENPGSRFVRQQTIFDQAPTQKLRNKDDETEEGEDNDITTESGPPPDLDADFANGLGHFGM
jgi:hypothetical protein